MSPVRFLQNTTLPAPIMATLITKRSYALLKNIIGHSSRFCIAHPTADADHRPQSPCRWRRDSIRLPVTDAKTMADRGVSQEAGHGSANGSAWVGACNW